MIIKWILEDIKPNQIRGPFATSEDSNYQIVFDLNSYLNLYLYKNRDCIYFDKIDYSFGKVTISDILVKCHQQIERYERRINTSRICCNCSHLIFKDYRHHEGVCSISHLPRNFEDICINEDIAENDRIRNE